MIVTIAGQKGGTGKTTLATNLAGMLAGQGYRVLLVDADPQYTAMEWIGKRPDTLAHVDFESVPGTLEGVQAGLQTALARAADIVILDTAGRISLAVSEAIRQCDFLLVPLLPSMPDVRSTEAFYQGALSSILRERTLRGALVLNGMQRGVALCQQAERYIREQTHLPLMQAVVHQYVTFRRAIGWGMTAQEAEPHGQAARDMQQLVMAIKEEAQL